MTHANAIAGTTRWIRGLVFICLAGTSYLSNAAPALDDDAHYKVDGLNHPAEIIVDEWGVPHIYARDHYDVFFAQGFNAARDRLWQLDLWRKRGLGKLSASLGARYVEQDMAARLFLYRQDMYSEWLAYGNDAKRIAQAFATGINAYIGLTESSPELLPPEFGLLGYKPERWQASDIVRIRSNGLWRNVSTEVWRARMACAGKLDLTHKWMQLEPRWETRVPAGLDPCSVPEDVLHLYELAKAPVDFDAPKLAAATAGSPTADGLGSNNWVVAPQRTDTGRPILADDPHRSLAAPSLRYMAHLVAPGINVIGAGEPALPGISIGHNERIAFGLTVFYLDQEDLYVYEKQGDGYLYNGRVEPFRTVVETIPVRDAPSEQHELKFGRHGPVVAETDRHAFVVRAAWLEPGMSPYYGSVEYMRAQNFREFVGALNRWGAPAENQVYADVDGNIGYKPAGRFPVRREWDGLLPVPGDGRYEWQGYFDMDVLPEEYNPKRGFTGTANSMNLPQDYPIDAYRVGFEWSNPYRYRRLWETLSADDTHSMAASLALQRDYTSVLARDVLTALTPLGNSDGAQLLEGWNFRLEPDSAAAALWAVWYGRHLEPGLSELVGGKALPANMPPFDPQTIVELVATPAGRNVALDTLDSAYAETRQLLGNDHARWQWGSLHQIRLQHPLLGLANGSLRTQMLLPRYPRGGSGNTTNATSYLADDFLVRSGASFRMVLDVGNWDAARATNAPGQSGDPRSRFYDNLLENWATEQHFPLLYTRQAIARHTAFTIRLEPRTPVDGDG